MVKYSLPGASVLQGAIDQIRAIRNGGTEHAIHSFNSSYKALKEAIKRSAELNQKLTDPRLLDLERARTAIQSQWPFLQSESDLNEKIVEAATKLEDLLKRETFYKEFPAIDQCTKTINDEFQRRHHEAVEARANVYEHALHELHKASGWEALNEEQRQRVSQPLSTRTERTASAHVGIPELRADMEACGARLNKAIVEMLQMVDGARLVTVKVSNFFNGGVDDEEQLDAALTGLREECIRLIATGKKVLVR
jgi:5'-deoxynucleotidase YfbR-like HD superfamily hydrolase